MENKAEITRFVNHAKVGVFGRLLLPSGDSVMTVERPWAGNEPHVSCIPSGVYLMRKRPSAVVERTTRWRKRGDGQWVRAAAGRYQEGWEITSVQGRSYIMIHPANLPGELEGCVAPGMDLGCVRGQWAVTRSQEAMDRVMEALAGRDEWMVDIRWATAPQWP